MNKEARRKNEKKIGRDLNEVEIELIPLAERVDNIVILLENNIDCSDFYLKSKYFDSNLLFMILGLGVRFTYSELMFREISYSQNRENISPINYWVNVLHDKNYLSKIVRNVEECFLENRKTIPYLKYMVNDKLFKEECDELKRNLLNLSFNKLTILKSLVDKCIHRNGQNPICQYYELFDLLIKVMIEKDSDEVVFVQN